MEDYNQKFKKITLEQSYISESIREIANKFEKEPLLNETAQLIRALQILEKDHLKIVRV